MTTAGALALATLICAAVDTQTTWLRFPWRPQDLALPGQTVVAWGALALLLSPLVAWAARRWKTPLTFALVFLAIPVALHQSVRGPLHGGGLTSWQAWIEPLLVLVAACGLLAVGRRLEPALGRRRFPFGSVTGLLAVIAMTPGLTGTTPESEPAPQRHVADPDRPNLLLLIWDTTRADHTSPYGADPELTPNLSALAEQGALYTSAWSASMFTLSSHVSLLSGLPPTLHGTSLRRQQVAVPTLPGLLRRAGYRSGAFVGTSVLVGGRGLQRDFDVYDDRVDPPVCDTALWSLVHDVQSAAAKAVPALRGNGLPHWFQDFQRPAPDVLAAARRFIDADDARPWFVMINLFDVHWPYLPEPEALQRFVRPYDGPVDGFLFRSDTYPLGHHPDEADKAHISDLYDAEMWSLDGVVDAFLDDLDLSRGDIAVVMTSDHGEGLGERDLWSHDDLHAPQTHVPLIVYAPGRVPPGQTIDAHASGLDVAPTLLALAGALPDDAPLPGTALVDAAPAADRLVFIQDYDNPDPAKDGHAVIRGRYKLIARFGKRTLHDVIDDPLDEVDVAAEHPEVAAELGAALDVLLAAESEESGELDNLDALRALGYIGN